MAPDPNAVDALDVYWRRGCVFCWTLFHQLDRAEIPYRRHDIWADPGAAARVRSVARGNETVPTVFIGDSAFVNPGIRRLVRAVHEQAPHLLAGKPAPNPTRDQNHEPPLADR